VRGIPLLVVLLASGWGCAHQIEARSLVVRVTDAETGSPLAAMPVMYGAHVAYRPFRISPWSEEFVTRWDGTVRGVTNQDGEARLEIGDIALSAWEVIESEEVFVNVEADMLSAGAQSVMSIERDRCKRGPHWCSKGIDEYVVAAEASLLPSRVENALRQATGQYEGLDLLLAAPGHWRREEVECQKAWLRTELLEMRRGGSAVVEVALKRAVAR
jgi:hypothetical protein